MGRDKKVNQHKQGEENRKTDMRDERRQLKG